LNPILNKNVHHDELILLQDNHWVAFDFLIHVIVDFVVKDVYSMNAEDW
jgi:hypothetical protein